MPSPPFPEVPKDAPSGIYKLFSSIKEALEIGLGRRGRPGEKFVTEDRLAEIGIIATPTSSSPTPSGALGNAAYKNVGTGAGTVAAGDHLHTGVYDPAGTAAAAVAAHEATGTHPWSAITDTDDAITVPDLIDTGETFSIAYRRQLIVCDIIEIVGTIDITGKLCVL